MTDISIIDHEQVAKPLPLAFVVVTEFDRQVFLAQPVMEQRHFEVQPMAADEMQLAWYV